MKVLVALALFVAAVSGGPDGHVNAGPWTVYGHGLLCHYYRLPNFHIGDHDTTVTTATTATECAGKCNGATGCNSFEYGTGDNDYTRAGNCRINNVDIYNPAVITSWQVNASGWDYYQLHDCVTAHHTVHVPYTLPSPLLYSPYYYNGAHYPYHHGFRHGVHHGVHTTEHHPHYPHYPPGVGHRHKHHTLTHHLAHQYGHAVPHGFHVDDADVGDSVHRGAVRHVHGLVNRVVLSAVQPEIGTAGHGRGAKSH